MSTQRGFALPVVMVLVVLTAALGSAVVQREQTLRRDVATDAEALRALHAAEGGLAQARHRLATDAAYTGETLTIGTCRVIIGVTSPEPGVWSVKSAASPGGCLLEVRLASTPDLPRFTAWSRKR